MDIDTPSNAFRRERTMHLNLVFDSTNKLQKTTLVLFKLVGLLLYLSFSYYKSFRDIRTFI
jgi:hypothetical protein